MTDPTTGDRGTGTPVAAVVAGLARDPSRKSDGLMVKASAFKNVSLGGLLAYAIYWGTTSLIPAISSSTERIERAIVAVGARVEVMADRVGENTAEVARVAGARGCAPCPKCPKCPDCLCPACPTTASNSNPATPKTLHHLLGNK